jgi:hypothetical protein
MLEVKITLQDFSWPIVNLIVQRGGKVKHLSLHYDRLEQEGTAAVADSLKLAIDELKQSHNPVID